MEKEIERDFPGSLAIEMPSVSQVTQWYESAQRVVPWDSLKAPQRERVPEKWSMRTISEKIRIDKRRQELEHGVETRRKRRRVSGSK